MIQWKFLYLGRFENLYLMWNTKFVRLDNDLRPSPRSLAHESPMLFLLTKISDTEVVYSLKILTFLLNYEVKICEIG